VAYPVDIVGNQTTLGGSEETLMLSINGSTPLDSFLIRTGTKVVFDSLVYEADAQAIFILQKSVDNGNTWFSVNTWNRPQSGSDMISQGSLISVEGGPQVRARVRVRTPGGAARVSSSMHGTFQAAA
jgi:hypothetical protein